MNVQALRKPTFDKSIFTDATQALIKVGAFLEAKGWTPAASGNVSARLDAEYAAITLSGASMGQLTAEQIVMVDLENVALDASKPSSETALHTMLYKLNDKIGAVLHTHSVNAVALTHMLEHKKKLKFSHYEILKTLDDVESPKTEITLPIFENTQDIAALAEEVREKLDGRRNVPGFLIRGHGLYGWGLDVASAQKSVEALEFLLACELLQRR